MPRLYELLDEVRTAGYSMHCVCLWAPLSVTRSRGEERSVREGKLWTPKDYPQSTRGTLAIAMRWLDGMRDQPSVYCSLELWDNTDFPAVEVGLEEFAALVTLSDAEADAHSRSLHESHHRVHSDLDHANRQAREKLGARKSFFAGVAGNNGRVSEGMPRKSFFGGGVEAGTGAPLRAANHLDDVEGGAALHSSKATWAAEGGTRARWRDWRRRGEGGVMGLLIGAMLGVGLARIWWSACS